MMRIVGVAIRCVNGDVLSLPKPARHCNLLDEYNNSAREAGWLFPWIGWGWERQEYGEHGFITDMGLFVDRVEALHIATVAGQMLGPRLSGAEILTSEDVW